jgi:hypothetical protein
MAGRWKDSNKSTPRFPNGLGKKWKVFLARRRGPRSEALPLPIHYREATHRVAGVGQSIARHFSLREKLEVEEVIQWVRAQFASRAMSSIGAVVVGVSVSRGSGAALRRAFVQISAFPSSWYTIVDSIQRGFCPGTRLVSLT